MLKDPKMDAAYFGTFSSTPEGGAETQEMLLKLWASPARTVGKKGKQTTHLRWLNLLKRKDTSSGDLARTVSACSKFPASLLNPQVPKFQAAGKLHLKMQSLKSN